MAGKSTRVRDAMARGRAVEDEPFDPSKIAGDNLDKAKRRSRARKPKATAEAPKGDAPPIDEREGDDDSGGDAGGYLDERRPDEEDQGLPDGLSEHDLALTRECLPLDPNDRDNARRLIIWFGNDVAYIAGMGWLTWRGTHWQRDENDLGARLLCQNLVDRIKLEALLIEATPFQARALAAAAPLLRKKKADRTDEDLAILERAAAIRRTIGKKRSDRLKFAISSGNAAKTTAMLAQAASLRSLPSDKLDANLKQFNVRNGTLEFRRVENVESDPDAPTFEWQCTLKPHDRTDMITKLAEVTFDPEATCPEFDKMMSTAHPDDAIRLFLMISHGYALLLGGNDEQRLIYHHGTGANGKSAMLETIGRLAGSYRAVVSPDSITGEGQRDGSKASSDIARLHAARFVTVDELPRGSPLRENLIKALTGGTRMTARFNFKDNFEFDPVFTAIMSGNDMPSVSGTDYGIWRRLLIVHWAVTIAEADRIPFGKLMDIFDQERSGILNWLIRGAVRYLNEGLSPFIPPAVTAFTEEYREELDPVGMWVRARVDRSAMYEHARISASDLYKNFTEWCEANAVKPWQVTAWGRRLNAMGFVKLRSSLVYYTGVALIERGGPTPPPTDPQAPGFQG